MFQCVKKSLADFAQNEEGATAIEYGLIAGLIALVIIASVTGVGNNMGTVYNNIGDAVQNATS
ncbi:MAG: Flp family type IVb pilin [Pseudomonadota bacterium]